MGCGIASNSPTVMCTICLINSTGMNREKHDRKRLRAATANKLVPILATRRASKDGCRFRCAALGCAVCTHPCTIFCYFLFLRVCTHPVRFLLCMYTCSTCTYLTRELPRLGGVTPCLPGVLFYFFMYLNLLHSNYWPGGPPDHPSCRCHAFERRGHVHAAGDRPGLA